MNDRPTLTAVFPFRGAPSFAPFAKGGAPRSILEARTFVGAPLVYPEARRAAPPIALGHPIPTEIASAQSPSVESHFVLYHSYYCNSRNSRHNHSAFCRYGTASLGSRWEAHLERCRRERSPGLGRCTSVKTAAASRCSPTHPQLHPRTLSGTRKRTEIGLTPTKQTIELDFERDSNRWCAQSISNRARAIRNRV
jgi:hypothetical protein